jgi:hypothetical protein
MIQRYEYYYGLLFVAIFFAWVVARPKYGTIAFGMLAWVLVSALLIAYYPPYTVDILSLRLRFVSSKSFLVVVTLTWFVASLRKDRVYLLLTFFEALIVINSVSYVWWKYGLFNAGSMDLAFMAMVYPVILFRPRRKNFAFYIQALTPLACLFVNRPGSTVYMALALALSVFFIKERKWKILFPMLLGLMALGYYKSYELGSYNFFSDSNRIAPWLQMMSWWWENANIWVGTGSGTFQWLGPEIQNAQTDGIFIWMHNEYLQIAFEQGLVGLALALGLIYFCVRGAWNRPWLLASIASTLFVFAVQFPLRFLFSQIFVLLLVRLALDKEFHRDY